MTSPRFTAVGLGALGLAAVCLALAAITDAQVLAVAGLVLVGGVALSVSIWRAGGPREWMRAIAASAAILAALVLVGIIVQQF